MYAFLFVLVPLAIVAAWALAHDRKRRCATCPAGHRPTRPGALYLASGPSPAHGTLQD
jgi:hypothetical protein